MRAQTLIGPGRFTMTQAPDRQETDLEPGELLVEVTVGGICGSDLPFFRGQLSPSRADDTRYGGAGFPGYPLHEVVGTVIASGSGLVAAGSMVVGWAFRTDALADQVVVRDCDVIAIDPPLPPTEAIVMQPLACALDTLDRIGDLHDRRVAVIGLGSMGVLFALAAKARGAGYVVGVDRIDRSLHADAFGLDEVVHSTSDRWARLIGVDQRPDVVIESVGHQIGTLADAIDAVASEGVVFAFGIPDDAVYPIAMQTLLRKNLTLMSGVVPIARREGALRKARQFLVHHPALPAAFVTDTVAFEDAQHAFDLANAPRPSQLKVVITW